MRENTTLPKTTKKGLEVLFDIRSTNSNNFQNFKSFSICDTKQNGSNRQFKPQPVVLAKRTNDSGFV